MSSYLLLRNNKESGPYTIDEIRGMTLKSYDLLWAVGKSAAWRYPGEIPELKSFAPPVPEQPSDPFSRKTAEESKSEADSTKKTESGHAGQTSKKTASELSFGAVYVNLPMQRRSIQSPSSKEIPPALPIPLEKTDYDFSDIYIRQSSGAARVSGKVLWISTIGLLFGAGILTGFFISDRRKFFSSETEHAPKAAFAHSASGINQKENTQTLIPLSQHDNADAGIFKNSDIRDSFQSVTKKQASYPIRKLKRENVVKKDSIVRTTSLSDLMKITDSAHHSTVAKADILSQKIKAHPENYLSLVTGNYKTGILGGVSSFSVSLTNNAPILMDLVVVTVDYIQSNNKIFKTESLSFTDLEAGETVSLKAPKSNRGTKIASRIHVVNIRQLDLSYSN